MEQSIENALNLEALFDLLFRLFAPDDFLPAARIIDYDGDVSKNLIEAGRTAAERAFQKNFA